MIELSLTRMLWHQLRVVFMLAGWCLLQLLASLTGRLSRRAATSAWRLRRRSLALHPQRLRLKDRDRSFAVAVDIETPRH
ncbi:MAG: hypothetical protein ACOYNZ_04240 [Rhodoferax sp.]